MGKRLTSVQRKWADEYKDHTGFDAMLDDFRAGNVTFTEAAKKSIRWFEDWSSDAYLRISNYPGEDDETPPSAA